MRERGRAPGFTMTSEHRSKIANSQILNRLIAHVEGKVEMTSTQVTAGVALLRKVMPDLTHTEGEVTVKASLEDLVMASFRRGKEDEAQDSVH